MGEGDAASLLVRASPGRALVDHLHRQQGALQPSRHTGRHPAVRGEAPSVDGVKDLVQQVCASNRCARVGAQQVLSTGPSLASTPSAIGTSALRPCAGGWLA
jgi:hypothetical protein